MLRELVVNIDCLDPDRLSGFWCEALGYRPEGSSGPYRSIVDPHGRHPKLVFQQVPEPKVGKTRIHLDLYVDHIATEVERLRQLGATVAADGGFDQGDERWQVMADPEGNEFCVCWH